MIYMCHIPCPHCMICAHPLRKSAQMEDLWSCIQVSEVISAGFFWGRPYWTGGYIYMNLSHLTPHRPSFPPPKKRKLSTHIWMLQFGKKKPTLVHRNFTTKEMDGSEQAWYVDLDKISPPRNHQTWWSWNRLTLTSKNWPRKFAGPPPDRFIWELNWRTWIQWFIIIWTFKTTVLWLLHPHVQIHMEFSQTYS